MLPIMAGVEGELLTPQERELFSRLQPAGYVLFARNIGDVDLVRELTDDLRRLTRGPYEPIIAVDQEGGRVVRTAALGVELPSAAALAASGSSHAIRQAAAYNARCLRSLGINTNFAPVLDLASPHANALPSRCWGADTQQVISYAGIWNRTAMQASILTCGKHFPGMGEAACDPHRDLPVLHGSRDTFLSNAAMPFTALMPELPSLMVAHLLIPEIDDQLPSSLSPHLVQGFLRDQLGYEGVVFTDDLCMGAITGRYQPEESVPLALRAGCDLPLVCHGACQVLEGIARQVQQLPGALLSAVEDRVCRFRLAIDTCSPMPFIAWNDYLGDVAAFTASVPEVAATPGSPVQDY